MLRDWVVEFVEKGTNDGYMAGICRLKIRGSRVTMMLMISPRDICSATGLPKEDLGYQ